MPNIFQIVSSADFKAAINTINQNFRRLDAEAVTKKFGAGGNQVIIGKAGDVIGMVVGDLAGDAIIYGKYRDDRFGTLKIQGGVPVALDGQHPVDGHQGTWIASPGKNVITELGGTW